MLLLSPGVPGCHPPPQPARGLGDPKGITGKVAWGFPGQAFPLQVSRQTGQDSAQIRPTSRSTEVRQARQEASPPPAQSCCWLPSSASDSAGFLAATPSSADTDNNSTSFPKLLPHEKQPRAHYPTHNHQSVETPKCPSAGGPSVQWNDPTPHTNRQ